ncbi:hypothetical protein ACN2XU_12960 [Primorskyibacter sp. 2E107]|uniref:hypothetical protein n=1 Tax=Primorskyibacter sp. 2E107 TaxID=3403458 RepID=UPI003AF571D8
MRTAITVVLALSLSACSSAGEFFRKPGAADPATNAEGQTRPEARPDSAVAPPPPQNARTAEEFDTTSAEERAAAAAPKPAGEVSLGSTVASLGDVARPGFWLETPLVTAPAKGRVLNPATGKSAQVDLIPIDGPATAGSRISLAAMRLLEAPLTDLPTIQVFSGG